MEKWNLKAAAATCQFASLHPVTCCKFAPMNRNALYDLADQLHRLAPWEWMHEQRLMFLHHPDTGERAFVSIMGQNREHISLALYLGEESLHRFNLIHEAEFEEIYLSREDMLSLILEARQIQVSFQARADLEAHELREIKSLGRKYRGINWPAFRSYRPGFMPAPINNEEAVWLTHAIGQIIEVAPLLREDPFAEYRSDETGTQWITRTMTNGRWETIWTPRDGQLFEFPDPAPSEILVAKVGMHPPDGDFECEFRMLHIPIGTKPGSRLFPYVLMSVHAGSGFVTGVELLSVEDKGHDALICSIPDAFLKIWDGYKVQPSAIRVSSQTSGAILRKTAEALGIPLIIQDNLPALDRAMDSLMMSMGAGY